MWNSWGETFCTWAKDNPLTTLNEIEQGPPPPPINLPGFLFAMDFNGDSSILYGIDIGPPTGPELGLIDQATGEWTSLMTIAGVTNGVIVDMSYDSSTDTMYVLATNTTAVGTLYTLDLFTGTITAVASLSNSDPLGGSPSDPLTLAVDSVGNMFVFSAGDDTLWSCDPATAECSAVGTLTGVTNNSFVQGMDFDPTTNILYHSAIDADASSNSLPGFYGSWDTSTGVFTALDTLQGIGGTAPSDLYQFKLAIGVLGPVADVTPDTLNLVTGVAAGGGLPQLQASDNIDFRSQRNIAGLQSRVVYELGATSPTETPSAMDFTIEESVFARGSVSRRFKRSTTQPVRLIRWILATHRGLTIEPTSSLSVVPCLTMSNQLLAAC